MARHLTEYVSEFTRFMDDYLKNHPEVVADQHVGRAIYWDKQVDLAEIEKAEADSVPVDSYYYFGNPSPRDTPPITAPRGKDAKS